MDIKSSFPVHGQYLLRVVLSVFEKTEKVVHFRKMSMFIGSKQVILKVY